MEGRVGGEEEDYYGCIREGCEWMEEDEEEEDEENGEICMKDVKQELEEKSGERFETSTTTTTTTTHSLTHLKNLTTFCPRRPTCPRISQNCTYEMEYSHLPDQ
ncbi:hypothetical protein E2C01_027266 [Portunus trituberculatus]|uniref:Uncharacterized protein n=1 Tax=Portunus trituberculatus TaxID=210409 RepID=A0A5B7EKN8_PORTR|nr:hypothetical protein [Portunus trituberculatus]